VFKNEHGCRGGPRVVAPGDGGGIEKVKRCGQGCRGSPRVASLSDGGGI
jgi:hypothetical protein